MKVSREERRLIYPSIEDHDEEFCRTVNLNGGATSTGTIYDRTAKKMHTWGVGDCTNIALFKDLETGEVTGESMITLHTAKNKEHLEKWVDREMNKLIHTGWKPTTRMPFIEVVGVILLNQPCSTVTSGSSLEALKLPDTGQQH